MAGTTGLAMADYGGAVAWVVPTYANARPVWRFAERIAATTPAVRVLKSERRFEFPSGGFLGVYTADNDVSIRGESFDLAIVDEAAQVREETWTDVIMPTLADRAGRAMLISTPKGKNWFYREFLRGQGDGRHQASFTAPTTANPMPTIQAAARLARERVSERTYRQEWLAEFIEDGGLVFRNVRLVSVMSPEAPIEGRQYIIGVDWGKSNDSTVCSVWDAAAKREVFLDRFSGVPWSIQYQRVAALAKRYNDALVIPETNAQQDAHANQLAALGVRAWGFVTTNQLKAYWVERISAELERQSIELQADQEGIVQMEAFESSELPSGQVRYSSPEGMHDDICLARIFAFSGVDVSGPVLLWG